MLLTVTCGIPGSGKSTWAARQGVVVLSADVLRTGPPTDRLAFLKAMEAQAREHLAFGDVVVDVCATTAAARGSWLKLGRSARAATRLVVMSTPIDVALARNARRERPVPDPVMTKYVAEFALSRSALPREGWDVVEDDVGAVLATRRRRVSVFSL